MNIRAYSVVSCTAALLACSGSGPAEQQDTPPEIELAVSPLVFDPSRDPLELRALPNSKSRLHAALWQIMVAYGATKPLETPNGTMLQDRWDVIEADVRVPALTAQAVEFELRARALTKHRTVRRVHNEFFAALTADAPCTDCTAGERNRRLQEACAKAQPRDPTYDIRTSVVSIENRGRVSGHNWWRAGCHYYRTTPLQCIKTGTRGRMCPFNVHDDESMVRLGVRCAMGQDSLLWTCQDTVGHYAIPPLKSTVEAILNEETRSAASSSAGYPNDLLECAINTSEFRQHCKIRDGGRFLTRVYLQKELNRLGHSFAIEKHFRSDSLHADWSPRVEMMLAWSSDTECWRPGAIGNLLATTDGGQTRLTVRDAGRTFFVPTRPKVTSEDPESEFFLVSAELTLSDEDESQSFEARIPAQCTLRFVDVRLAFDSEGLTRRLYYLAGRAQDKRDLMASALVVHGFLTRQKQGALCAVRQLTTALQGAHGGAAEAMPQSWKDTVGSAVVQAAQSGAFADEDTPTPITDTEDGWQYFRDRPDLFNQAACDGATFKYRTMEALGPDAPEDVRRNASVYLGARAKLKDILTEGWAITQAARMPVPPTAREQHLEWLLAGIPDGEMN